MFSIRHIGIKALESLRKWAADQQKRDTALEMQDQQKGGPASGIFVAYSLSVHCTRHDISVFVVVCWRRRSG